MEQWSTLYITCASVYASSLVVRAQYARIDSLSHTVISTARHTIQYLRTQYTLHTPNTNNSLPTTLPVSSLLRIITMVNPPPPYSPSAPPPAHFPQGQPPTSAPIQLPRERFNPSSVSDLLPTPPQQAQRSSSPRVHLPLPVPPTQNTFPTLPHLAFNPPPQPPASWQRPMAYISQTQSQQTTAASTVPAPNTTSLASEARSTRGRPEDSRIGCLCLGCAFAIIECCKQLCTCICSCLCCPCLMCILCIGEWGVE